MAPSKIQKFIRVPMRLCESVGKPLGHIHPNLIRFYSKVHPAAVFGQHALPVYMHTCGWRTVIVWGKTKWKYLNTYSETVQLSLDWSSNILVFVASVNRTNWLESILTAFIYSIFIWRALGTRNFSITNDCCFHCRSVILAYI